MRIIQLKFFTKCLKGNIPLKVVPFFSYAFCLAHLWILLIIPSANGYEFSIYEAYPKIFWFCIIGSIFTGQILLIKCSFDESSKKYCLLGIISILVSDSVLLFMPMIRGYVAYGRGDTLSHLGMAKDILSTGCFGVSNIYPLDHILISILFLLSNIKLATLSMVIPPIFSLAFIAFFYILSKEVFLDKSLSLLTLIFTTTLMFGYFHQMFAPYIQAFFVIPLVLYLFFKSRMNECRMDFHALLIIFSIFIVFFHPLTSIILIGIICVFEISIRFQPNYENISIKFGRSLKLIILNLVVFLSWSAYLYILVRSLDRIRNSFFDPGIKSEFQKTIDVINYGDVGPILLIKSVLLTYGQMIIIILLSLLFIISIIYNFLILTGALEKPRFFYIFASIGFLSFSVSSVFVYIAAAYFGFMRILDIAICFSIWLLSPLVFIIFSPANKKRQLFPKVFLSFFLLMIIIFSVFNLYSSPLIRLSNQQVAESELNGMNTFYNVRNIDTPILNFGLSQFRFHDGLFGRDSSPRTNIRYGVDEVPVDHFDYLHNDSLKFRYNNSYLLLNSLGRNAYPYLYPEFREKWRFTPSDFSRLQKDYYVKKIYDNYNLNIYHIN